VNRALMAFVAWAKQLDARRDLDVSTPGSLGSST
jgi:hypothetical protein